jgi:hypothetical protein
LRNAPLLEPECLEESSAGHWTTAHNEDTPEIQVMEGICNKQIQHFHAIAVMRMLLLNKYANSA